VAAVVASAFRILPDAICGAHRGPARVAFARQVAIYLSHTRLGLTYAAAGSIFGRDRTTAAYACRTVEDKREDPTLDAILDCLERAVDIWSVAVASGGRDREQA
jgi:chromosomal replication initiation ATPase DnaA